MSDYDTQSVEMHALTHGKLAARSKVPLATRKDLRLAYTPGVAGAVADAARRSGVCRG